MAPSPITSSERGGCSYARIGYVAPHSFSSGRTRDFGQRHPNRSYTAGRQRFSVSTDPEGTQHITLDAGETATILRAGRR